MQTMLAGSTFILLAFSATLKAADFDHHYKNYDQLLKQVVNLSADKKQSRVDYQLLTNKKEPLQLALQTFSNVTKNQYDTWNEPQKLSFLINAYNGFTLQLIVDHWSEFKQGDAESIRDLGSFFTTPWEKEFFTLFQKKHNLDDIEHEMVRKWFKEPRIHAVLVCAAVSCPPLRNQAYIADSLNQQLDNQMYIFLADNTRNYIDGKKGKAYLSSIFKWYRGDFEKGDAGFSSLYDLLQKYNKALISGEQEQAIRSLLMNNDFPILFKDYDWRLNDVANF